MPGLLLNVMMDTTPQFRNLIFEGGGIKGIAYIGALEILSQRGHLDHLTRVGGTSAGAINALILALGYSIREQQLILESTNFKDFMDSSFGFIRNVNRLAHKFGYHKGDFCSRAPATARMSTTARPKGCAWTPKARSACSATTSQRAASPSSASATTPKPC